MVISDKARFPAFGFGPPGEKAQVGEASVPRPWELHTPQNSKSQEIERLVSFLIQETKEPLKTCVVRWTQVKEETN